MAVNPFEMIGGVVDDIVGGVTDPVTGADDVKAAQEALQQQYRQNMELLKAYRPKAAQAREQGLAHQLGAYDPANEYLKQMWGDEFGLDLEGLGQPGIADILGSVEMPSMQGAGQEEPGMLNGEPMNEFEQMIGKPAAEKIEKAVVGGRRGGTPPPETGRMGGFAPRSKELNPELTNQVKAIGSTDRRRERDRIRRQKAMANR